LKKNEIFKFHEEWNWFHPSKCRGKVQKLGEETLKGLFSNLLIPAAHLFGLMKSYLPILLLKFSNIHNYWSVGPRVMKFVLLQSLFRDAGTQKVSKNLKIEWDQVTCPKTGLSTVWTFGPLRVEPRKIINIILPKLQTICKIRWELTKLINTVTNLDPKVTNHEYCCADLSSVMNLTIPIHSIVGCGSQQAYQYRFRLRETKSIIVRRKDNGEWMKFAPFI
jgi:hypothetical protein